MCGIISYVGSKNSKEVLVNGLKHLEYRGYDSSGLSVISNNKILTYKSVGKLKQLETQLQSIKVDSNIGIGHTRWATHGEPSLENAHPHSSINKSIVLVHNGIIENYEELKEKLLLQNVSFYGKTDSEVVVKYIESIYRGNPIETLDLINKILIGTYALSILFLDHPDKVFFLKKGSPLIIGKDNSGLYLSSDYVSLENVISEIIYLKDNQYGYISSSNYKVYSNKESVPYFFQKLNNIPVFTKKIINSTYLEKEIYETPYVIKNIINKYIINNEVGFIDLKFDALKTINILGCGSSFNAGLIGKYLFESLCKIPTNVFLGSEFPSTPKINNENALNIIISQSGETADLISCLPLIRGYKLGIINVKNSSLSLEMDKTLYLEAGSEISVATTKAYVGQLTFLYLLAIYLSKENKFISNEYYLSLVNEMKNIPSKIELILNNHLHIKDFAFILKNYKNVFFIGKGLDYLTCIEGSLKLKEVTYIHSEAIASGELKHGTISLIDENIYTIALLSSSQKNKTKNNIEEIKARKGKVFTISSVDSDYNIPSTMDLFYPLIEIIPLQLLALYTGTYKNLDIDKPRNLAKSVTVE